MSDWPEYTHFDGTLDAYMRRMGALSEALVERGGFTNQDTVRILAGGVSEKVEQAARWLRTELEHLREAEKITGEAPVLTGRSMSRALIADLAMAMLEAADRGQDEQLLCLMMELLDVDRHRRSLAGTPSEARQKAAQIEALDPEIGVRALAKKVGVAPSTVTAWRRSPGYLREVESVKWVLESSPRSERFNKK